MKDMIKSLAEKLLSFFRRDIEKLVIKYLRELAARSDNKVDDRLVEAVATAINNGSYLTYLKKAKTAIESK